MGVKLRATQHFYDSNLWPRQITRGKVFEVNDETQARDFAHLSEPYTGDEEPVATTTIPKVQEALTLDRKSKEKPLNKMADDPANK